jgi:hypothetical protein
MHLFLEQRARCLSVSEFSARPKIDVFYRIYTIFGRPFLWFVSFGRTKEMIALAAAKTIRAKLDFLKNMSL